MFQDFHFKLVHRPGSKHANVDALSRNPMDKYKVDEDFGNEIQDLAGITQDSETIINLFDVLIGQEEDHDVDHYEKGEELIAFKAKTPPQVETNQQLVTMKNQCKVIGI